MDGALISGILWRISPTESTEFAEQWWNFALVIVAAQIRMARAALGLSVRELAQRSGIAESTILRFETARGGVLATTLERLQRTLEEGGVIFIDTDARGGPGVRLLG